MLGSKKLVIGPREFMRGMSTSQYSEDGFISPASTLGLNLSTMPGVIWGQYPSTSIDSGVVEKYIASYGDSAFPGKYKYFLTSTGKFISYNGTSNTLEFTEGVRTYAYATSDLVQYKGNLFATSTGNITMATVGGGGSLTLSSNQWWTAVRGHGSLSSSTRHPMVVYEDILWIADGASLHKWDGTTSSASALSLAQDQSITALGIDPSSGKMLIATTQGANYSNTLPKVNRILVWDGFSNKPLRSIIVDDMVTCFYAMGGMVYIGYGKNLGYWNGSGISFLRRLSNFEAIYDGDYLLYKSHITNIGSCLYYIDGNMVYAYESLMSGTSKVFYPAYSPTDVTPIAGLDLITDLGSNDLGVSYRSSSTGTFRLNKYPTRSINVGGDQSLAFKTRNFLFDERIKIKAVRIIFQSPLPLDKIPLSLQAVSSTLVINFEDWYVKALGQGAYDFLPANALKDEMNEFCLQFYPSSTQTSPGIRKIIIGYDDVE